MKNTTFILATAMLLGAATAGAVPDAALPLAGPTPQNHFVAFHALPEDRSSYHGEPVRHVDEDLRFFLVETRNPAMLEMRARMDANVRYVQPEFYADDIRLHVPNDPLYSDAGHWGSKKIGAEGAWDVTFGSTAVIVAVIDSGLSKHEEFVGQSRVLQGYDFVDNDNDPSNEAGGCGNHGTHVTGTAAATIDNGLGIAGIAQSTVLPIKGLGTGACGSSTSIIVSSIKYAADQGAHVNTNSWYWPYDDAVVRDAILYSYNKGTLIVAAAGNDGPCADCVNKPWRHSPNEVTIVASTTSGDGLSGFSSQGPTVDVAAPGSSIISSCGSGAKYCTKSGTSMAAPHVAGTAALVKTVNPTFTHAQIDQRLKETAIDLGPSGFDESFGHGRIDACAAVGSTTCGGGSTPPPAPGDATVHTHDIRHWIDGKTPKFQVFAYDGAEAPVDAVSVTVSVCKGSSDCASGTASTGADGSVTFQWRNKGSGTYTTCVTGMAKSGYTWDSAAGHASGGNCHTSTV